jgi:hypothetical protein
MLGSEVFMLTIAGGILISVVAFFLIGAVGVGAWLLRGMCKATNG